MTGSARWIYIKLPRRLWSRSSVLTVSYSEQFFSSTTPLCWANRGDENFWVNHFKHKNLQMLCFRTLQQCIVGMKYLASLWTFLHNTSKLAIALFLWVMKITYVKWKIIINSNEIIYFTTNTSYSNTINKIHVKTFERLSSSHNVFDF